MASTILVDREGLKCEKQLALQGQLETAMKRTKCYPFDALGPTWNAAPLFFLFASGGLKFFFFERHVDQTVDRLGTRVEFTETEDFRGAQTSTLDHGGRFRKLEHKALGIMCMLTCMVTGQPLVEDGLSSRDKHDEANTLAQMQVTVGFWLLMYGYSSPHTNAKARESSKTT